MKKFKFSLERVLDIRIEEEREALLSMKIAKDELYDAECALDRLNDDKVAARNSKYADIILSKQNIIYINFLNGKIDNQKNMVEEKKQKYMNKKDELRKKNIEKKTLEKLKQIKLNEYMDEMGRIERRMNDEFALNSFNLNKLKGGEKND